MKHNDCIFCKIVEREISSKIIFENDFTIAFLDNAPISNGHTIIIPKNHYSNLEDISEDELSEVFKVTKKLAIRIHKNLQVDGYNILQNNFIAAGQVIKHFHVHIIPRSYDDKKFQITIPKVQVSEEKLEEIFKILRA
ncbi:MAG: HIT family protein [Candidatus Hodarchaeota archaeon]